MSDYQYIRDAEGLAALVDTIGNAPRIALDTEFMRERTYYAKLCLVQVATADTLAAIDPLEVEDLSAFWEAINGGPEVVFHAAGQDLEIIADASGAVPATHFDTQVAAAFLGYGDSIGYARLVDRVIGRVPSRSEAYTDWTRRPLSDDQIEYALDDVRYLLQIADTLQSGLDDSGRDTWVREELAAAAAGVKPATDPEQVWRKVRGARSLQGKKLAALQGVAGWRERTAQRRDIPRQRVVPDRVLVEIAKRMPRKPAQIERLRGMHPREAQRSAAAILEAVAEAVARPEVDYPEWGTQPGRAGDPRVEMIAALLDSVLRGVAAQMNMSSRLLANRRDLETLVRYRLDGADYPPIPVLKGWRRESVGDRLLEVLAGDLAVALDDSGGDGPQLALRTVTPED